MNFAALSAAWLFALLVPLIIFYFLKLKRPRQTISSLALWRQVLSDQRVNSPFQKFKRNLLLLLQIILLVLLALAAMQPFIRREPSRADRLPVLVDTSASMAALDGPKGKSRLEEAKQRLRERIDSLLPDQEIAIIAFSKNARKLTGFTNNKSVLRDAVAALEVEDLPGDLEEGLRLAQALARTHSFDRVLLLTDGNVPERANFELPFKLDLQKLPPPGPNAGISSLNARRTASGDWDVLVQLVATDPAPSNTARVILSVDGTELANETLAVEAGGAPRISFRVSGARDELLVATLQTDGFDSLESDNRAWLNLPAMRPLDVHLPESLATFRHAISSLPNIRLFPQPDTPSPGAFDLAFSDKGSAPPARFTCNIGTVPKELESFVSIQKGNIGVIDWRRESLLLQHVSLDEVLFMDDPVRAGGKDDSAFAAMGFDTLIQGPHGPLALYRGEGVDAGGSARLDLLFHPDRSTLPFRVAFPIFVSNLVQASQRLAGLSESNAIATGVLPPRSFPPGSSIAVSGPLGSRADKTDESGILNGIPAPRTGVYTLKGAGSELRLGASLLSTSESTLASVDAIAFPDRITVSAETAAPKTDRSLWWILAAAGFAILLAEWWWFQRRPF